MKKIIDLHGNTEIPDTKKLLRLMKLITFFILISVGSVFASKSYSQNKMLTLHMTNSTVKEVLAEIEDQSEFRFMYSGKFIDVNREVSIDVENQTIVPVLNTLFAGTDVSYTVKDRFIVLVTPELMYESTVAAIQQQRSVSGNVTDLNNQPLPGVTVLVKGTTQGAVTDINGDYSLTNIPEDAILVFSFVGMRTQEMVAGDQTNINVRMEEEAIGLEEVVAVGYGVQKKATLTGSISSVRADDLVQRPVANTTELLQGQAVGLFTRQSSGLPGSDATTLNIRGFGSPLIIVDGTETSFDQIDPNDIESISVLKDASAAVYGARAGNGVILVTTKRGDDAPAKISYHGSISATQPTFLPKHVQAREWAEMLDETGLNVADYSPDNVVYNPDNKKLTNAVDGSIFKGYNWSEALYRNWTPQHQHNISAIGGTQKIKYFISGGFTGQASNFKSGDYNYTRYNIRSNIDADITDNIGISVDFSYRTTVLDKANFEVDYMYNSLQTAKPIYPYIHEQDPYRATFSGYLQRSPYFQTFKDFSGFLENGSKVLQGIIEFKYSFPMVKGLSAKASLNFEEASTWNKQVTKPFDVWQYNPLAAQQGKNPWTKQGTQNSSIMGVYSDDGRNLLPLVDLNYNRLVGSHSIKAQLISETRTYKFTSLSGDRKDILSYEAPYLGYASTEGMSNNEGTIQNARSSIIGRLNYDYLGKYMFELSMRADASAEYPPSGRWGYFPSVSAGWRISDEAFLNEFSALNNLKLRGSYGVLGNDAISSFDYLTGYNITTDYYVFGNLPAPIITSAGLANPNITWETIKISNIGLDGVLWDGMLGFIIDGFYRLRENILAQPITQAPSTFGVKMPLTNLNKQDNRGVEISLTHNNKVGDISYDVSPKFSWTRGKYVKIDENVLPVTDDLDEETSVTSSVN